MRADFFLIPALPKRMSGRTRKQGSCGAYGVDGALRGSMIGCMWGLFSSSYYGWHDNLRGRVLASHIGRNAILNSCGFAAFLGLYQFTHCSMEASRKSCDWKNAAVAGLVTGGVMGLPVALRAGEPRLALMAAGLTAGLTGGLDLARGNG